MTIDVERDEHERRQAESAAQVAGSIYPLHSVVDGVAMVTIPADEYALLLADRLPPLEVPAETDERDFGRFVVAVLDAMALDGGRRTSAELDREVAVFLAKAFRTTPVSKARELCLDAFGELRTPSSSAVHRFFVRFQATARREGLKP